MGFVQVENKKIVANKMFRTKTILSLLPTSVAIASNLQNNPSSRAFIFLYISQNNRREYQSI